MSDLDPTDRAARRRADIVEAAGRVFATKGYHAAGIADIAEDLGIGHGTFYRYFANKLDIFAHVVDAVVGRIAEVVTAEDPNATETLGDYRSQTARIARRLIDLLHADRALTRIFFFEAPGVAPEIDAALEEARELFARYTELYFQNGVRRGFLRADLDTRTTARAVNAMIFEAAREVAVAGDAEGTSDAWIDAVMALLFTGIADGGGA